MHIVLQDEFLFQDGSRSAGREFRDHILAQLDAAPEDHLIIDFAGIRTLGTGFADEVFGRLFVSIGATDFMTRIELRNATGVVNASIDRAISMRAATGNGGERAPEPTG